MLQNINEIMTVLQSYDIETVIINNRKNIIYIKTKDGSTYEYEISSIISKTKMMIEANKQGIYCILN